MAGLQEKLVQFWKTRWGKVAAAGTAAITLLGVVGSIAGIIDFLNLNPFKDSVVTPSETPAIPANEVTIELLSLTTPIPSGELASLSIRTQPRASCFLAYTTPTGSISGARGLGPVTAGEDGVCAWEWRIGSSTRAGSGDLTITVGVKTEHFLIEIVEVKTP